ncbi:MAG: hypothetical protein S4CHLAM20_05100 [Chlamydiia bacterium]|nr:hypothetical protein [Chlamydiia bacterium]
MKIEISTFQTKVAMNWLENKFPTTPIRDIDIDYFRKLESDPDFQKQKKKIISGIEEDVDYYVLQIMYAHVGNVKHISEFTKIINEQLFKEIKCFKETFDSSVEGFMKMKKSMEPEQQEVPPAYEE